MILAILVAIWFGYLAHKTGKSKVLWTLIGAVISFVSSAVIFNLLVAVLGWIDYRVALFASAFIVALMVFIAWFSFGPVALTSSGSVLLHVCLLTLALLCLLPFIWLVCATFKNNEDFFVYAFLPWGHPERWTLVNYRWLLTKEPFLTWLFNSLFLSCIHTCLVVTLSSLGGFALAKYRFFGKRPLMLMMLATMMVPSQVLLPSSYLLMYHLGWLDSYAAIIVPAAVSVFGMFLFMQAMKSVPDELLQAGRVDGCSEIRLWWEVALPIVRPMIGAYTLLSFMGAWNSFLWPQIVLQSQNKYTLPIGMTNLLGLPEYQTPYGVLMCGTLLSIVPVAILFFILQRDFISGLASGAIKG